MGERHVGLSLRLSGTPEKWVAGGHRKTVAVYPGMVPVERGGNKMSEWISVEDRLPQEGVKVLTLDKWGHIRDRNLQKYWTGDKAYFRPDGMEPGRDITHWMPLPEPPKETHKK